MSDLNTVQLTGRIARDPELRTTASGKSVSNLRVASNGYGDKTIWADVSVWGKQAENVVRYLRKGSRLAISGRLEPVRTWEKDGVMAGAALEITANEVVFLDTKAEGQQTSAPATPAATPAAQPAQDDNSDVPF